MTLREFIKQLKKMDLDDSIKVEMADNGDLMIGTFEECWNTFNSPPVILISEPPPKFVKRWG